MPQPAALRHGTSTRSGIARRGGAAAGGCTQALCGPVRKA
ncbi:hypothetical protein [Azospirillum largimobile]